MDLSAWHYFLALERDFVRTLDYVELATANDNTYSNEYAKLLLLLGSEIDVVAQALCRDCNPNSSASTIDAYRTELTKSFVGIHTIEIDIPRHKLSHKPWETWGDNPPKSPPWWHAYQKVKHERDRQFSLATQFNVTEALCGLLALELYVFRREKHLQPYPELLAYGFPDYLVTSNSKKLPGT